MALAGTRRRSHRGTFSPRCPFASHRIARFKLAAPCPPHPAKPQSPSHKLSSLYLVLSPSFLKNSTNLAREVSPRACSLIEFRRLLVVSPSLHVSISCELRLCWHALLGPGRILPSFHRGSLPPRCFMILSKAMESARDLRSVKNSSRTVRNRSYDERSNRKGIVDQGLDIESIRPTGPPNQGLSNA